MAIGAAAGLLLAGVIIVLSVDWIGPYKGAAASAPVECWDPALPLLPLAAFCLLNLQP